MRVRVGLTAWEMCPVIFVGTYNAGMWCWKIVLGLGLGL